ncbi:Abasic site processing protein [Hyphomicrobiales bacterium]|nr:Abasic site processing protein [Hyphomicrobiales bacterium]CAH1675372.1 Abasic site processing protein [Hyphomicrobiales bacterium]
MAQKGLAPKINATAEALATSSMWRSSHNKRRCIIPVDNFFEWQPANAGNPKHPSAIAMADREPFGLAGIWTAYERAPGQWQHNFAIITCPANELVSKIHHRTPAILAQAPYERWLACIKPDPHDLLTPFPSDLMPAHRKTLCVSDAAASPVRGL